MKETAVVNRLCITCVFFLSHVVSLFVYHFVFLSYSLLYQLLPVLDMRKEKETDVKKGLPTGVKNPKHFVK